MYMAELELDDYRRSIETGIWGKLDDNVDLIKLAADIEREALNINRHDNIDYHYNVVIRTDGTVESGDLHTTYNTWTRWHRTDNIVAKFNVYPAYTSCHMEDAGDDPNNVDDVECWETQAAKAIKTYAYEMAQAIDSGEPLNEIFIDLNW